MLWLTIYPVSQLAAQSSRRAYSQADQLARSLTGRELSAPFSEPLDDSRPLLSIESLLRWLGIGALVYVLCLVILGLAAQLAQERAIGMLLRLAFGVFLFGNLMVVGQRLRNVWFFRALAKRPQAAFDAMQRQEPQILYWAGLATYLQAALLLLAAWVVTPSAWLFGGAVGLLLRARRYRQSLLELQPGEEPSQGAS